MRLCTSNSCAGAEPHVLVPVLDEDTVTLRTGNVSRVQHSQLFYFLGKVIFLLYRIDLAVGQRRGAVHVVFVPIDQENMPRTKP